MTNASSGTPLWGQAWELAITCATEGGGAQTTTIGSSSWTPEPLRVTFDVLQSMNTDPLWYADISVYNLDDQTAQNITVNATWAVLKAGYQFGPQVSSVIWAGPVFQVLFTRENVVDQKLTLHCVVFPNVAPTDMLSFSMGQFSTQQQLVARMVQEANLPPVNPGSGTQGQVAFQRMTATQYPRGNTVFGKVSRYFGQLADSNLVQTWTDGQKTYISEMGNNDASLTPNLIYSPPFPPGSVGSAAGLPAGTNMSIVGTPQQFAQGATFNVLLDPRLQVQMPPLLVQLVRTQINLLTRNPAPNSELPAPLTSNPKFFVAQVRHTGDTRGNEWNTEVTGWSTAYAQAYLNMFTG
jgi:hypothetical protein